MSFDPSQVQSVADLGCGNGILVAGSLGAFPNAIIHAVDYWDTLAPALKSQSRVCFHQGLITQVISQGLIPPTDVVIMSFMNTLHGFTGSEKHLLPSIARGILITVGDNADMERTVWFNAFFQCIKGDSFSMESVWVKKQGR